MAKGIRLSEKHGLNPCVSECYICGESKNEILLTGHAGESMARKLGRSDGEMPRSAVFDLEPCAACKERGIAFIEMTGEGEGHGPTGRRLLIKDSAVRAFVTPPELLEHLLEARACFLVKETFDLLLSKFEK